MIEYMKKHRRKAAVILTTVFVMGIATASYAAAITKPWMSIFPNLTQ